MKEPKYLKKNQSHSVPIAVIVTVKKQGFNYTLHSIPSNKSKQLPTLVYEIIRALEIPVKAFCPGYTLASWL